MTSCHLSAYNKPSNVSQSLPDLKPLHDMAHACLLLWNNFTYFFATSFISKGKFNTVPGVLSP